MAIADTGMNPVNNTGNWTATFDAHDLTLPQGQFEISKMQIIGGKPGASLTVYKDIHVQDNCVLDGSGNASWYKASDGEFVIGGASNVGQLFFYFSNPATDGFQALVKLWLLYDSGLLMNINAGLGS